MATPAPPPPPSRPAAPTESGRHALGRLLRPRASRPQVVIAALCLVLGFGIAVTARSAASDAGLRTARQEDLARILADVSARSDRLQTQIDALAATRTRLSDATQRDQAAAEQAQQQADALAVLTGTVPASGPGVVATVADPQRQVPAPVLVEAVNELRDAGAETMQLGPVRVVVSTWVADDPAGGLLVDGTHLDPPYRLAAVGPAATMAAALRIVGGVADAVTSRPGASLAVSTPAAVRVDAVATLPSPRYARPTG